MKTKESKLLVFRRIAAGKLTHENSCFSSAGCAFVRLFVVG